MNQKDADNREDQASAQGQGGSQTESLQDSSEDTE